MQRIAVVLAIVASLTVPAAIACKIYELVKLLAAGLLLLVLMGGLD